jgi:hypothetical protein
MWDTPLLYKDIDQKACHIQYYQIALKKAQILLDPKDDKGCAAFL